MFKLIYKYNSQKHETDVLFFKRVLTGFVRGVKFLISPYASVPNLPGIAKCLPIFDLNLKKGYITLTSIL
jgi:hypothetical protein